MRQELGVGDVGDLRGDDRASLLVELVAGPVGMRHRQLVDLAVVLAQEDGLQGGEVGIFPNPDISGHVGTIDDRQVIALRGQQITARTAQTGSGGRIRAIDHRAVDPARHVIGGGGRTAGDTGQRVDDRTGHRDRTAQHGVAVRNRDVDVGDVVRQGEVDVVVDELTPGVHHPGQSLGIRGLGIAGDHQIADRAGVGQVGAKRRDPIAELGRADPGEGGTDDIEASGGEVVPAAVDGAVADRRSRRPGRGGNALLRPGGGGCGRGPGGRGSGPGGRGGPGRGDSECRAAGRAGCCPGGRAAVGSVRRGGRAIG